MRPAGHISPPAGLEDYKRESEMDWFWLNTLLAAAFFGAWTGIPLWLVVRHPDTGPQPRAVSLALQGHSGKVARPQPESVRERDSKQLAAAQVT